MSDREPVGSLAEEAAKLLAAVHIWAGDSGTASGHPTDGDPADGHPADGHPADGHPADGHPTDGRGADAHAAECRWCPLCQLARMAKATSPEVRDHLSQAAVSLALALKGLLDDPATTPRRETPLEKIDLTEE